MNVDEDHDEVHYSNVAFRGEAGELLSGAIEVLTQHRAGPPLAYCQRGDSA